MNDAEANLAQALQAGIPLDEYARQSAVTLNTVYTQLRRIKEKTGRTRIAELHRSSRSLRCRSAKIERSGVQWVA